jgi:hypothetical protein
LNERSEEKGRRASESQFEKMSKILFRDNCPLERRKITNIKFVLLSEARKKDSALQSRNSAEKDLVLPKRNSGSETRVIKEESLWTEILTEQKRKEKI